MTKRRKRTFQPDRVLSYFKKEWKVLVLAALKRVAKERTVISISHRTSAELGRTIQV